MGKKDTMTKAYLSERKYFADAFNGGVFDGVQVISADEMLLQEMDPTELGIVFANEETDIVQKYRDILKKCVLMSNGKMRFLLLGIENQSEVHYAMPVRNLLYDALNYGQQVNQIAAKHRKEKDLKDAEFLSGFSKMDKIIPVISLVVYFGSDKWDGPRSLKEMFPEDIDEEILNEVEDYRLHLIIPSEIKDFSKFKTDFGKVMKYIAASEDKDALKEVTDEEEGRTVGADSIRLINECIGSDIVILKEEEEIGMSMCKGLRDWSEEERQIGKEEGKSELLNSLVCKKLRKNLSLEAIAEDLEVDIEVIRPIYEKVKQELDSKDK